LRGPSHWTASVEIELVFEACGAAPERCRRRWSPRCARWAGRWCFLLPSAAFDRHRSGALEDMSEASLPRGEPHVFGAPSPLLSPSKRPHGAGPLAVSDRRRSAGDTGTLPLLGFVALLPLHRSHPSRVHSRHRTVVHDPMRWLRGAMGPTAPPVQPLVPTSWFRTTSPVCSARRTAGLLHPAAGPGVRRVALGLLPPHRRSTPRGRRPGVEARQVSCPRRFDPSKSSPRSQPCGVTTA
jgi:hypothetical protein